MTSNRSLILNLFLLPKRALSWVYYIFRGQFSSCSRQIKMKLRTTLTLLSSFFTVGTSNIQRMRLFRKGETPNHLFFTFVYEVGRPSIVRVGPVPKQEFRHHSEDGLTATSLKANTRSNHPLFKFDSTKTISFVQDGSLLISYVTWSALLVTKLSCNVCGKGVLGQILIRGRAHIT